jgi:hypothetical protein
MDSVLKRKDQSGTREDGQTSVTGAVSRARELPDLQGAKGRTASRLQYFHFTASILEAIQQEANHAAARYGDFASTHEALGVLTEEYHELLEAIRSNQIKSISREALQVAAVALRIVAYCDYPEFLDRSVK